MREIELDQMYTAHGQHWGPGVAKINTGNAERDDEIAATLEAAVERNKEAAEEQQSEADQAVEERVAELLKLRKDDMIAMVEDDAVLKEQIDDPASMRKDRLARAIAEAEQEDEA